MVKASFISGLTRDRRIGSGTAGKYTNQSNWEQMGNDDWAGSDSSKIIVYFVNSNFSISTIW